jgi:hypothetical protein
MNGDATREPRMPGIQKLTEHRPVGVLKRCCIICGARIKRSAGGHRTRLTSANRRRRHGPPDAMPRRCCEFVDSRRAGPRLTAPARSPMDKPGKTLCVSPTLPTGRRLPSDYGIVLAQPLVGISKSSGRATLPLRRRWRESAPTE